MRGVTLGHPAAGTVPVRSPGPQSSRSGPGSGTGEEPSAAAPVSGGNANPEDLLSVSASSTLVPFAAGKWLSRRLIDHQRKKKLSCNSFQSWWWRRAGTCASPAAAVPAQPWGELNPRARGMELTPVKKTRRGEKGRGEATAAQVKRTRGTCPVSAEEGSMTTGQQGPTRPGQWLRRGRAQEEQGFAASPLSGAFTRASGFLRVRNTSKALLGPTERTLQLRYPAARNKQPWFPLQRKNCRVCPHTGPQGQPYAAVTPRHPPAAHGSPAFATSKALMVLRPHLCTSAPTPLFPC